MGISSALYTGVSGLNTNGNAMSVIGNNLANTNTTAYKGSRTLFSDLLASTVSGSGGSSQVGRGVGLSTVDNVFSQGTFATTSGALDVAIEGSSFFLVNEPGETTNLYTRAGAFSFDQNGYLTNSEGLRVQGVSYNDEGQLIGGNPTDIFLDSEGLVAGQATDELVLNTNLASNSEVVALAFSNTNPDTYSFAESTSNIAIDGGTESATVNMFYRNTAPDTWEVYYSAESSTGQTTVDPPTLFQTITADPNSASGFVIAGTTTDYVGLTTTDDITWSDNTTSNVDATLAVADVADVSAETNNVLYFDYQNPDTYTYSASVQTYDSLGNPHLLTSYYRKSGDDESNTWEVYYSAEDEAGGMIPANPNAQPITTLKFGSNGMPVDPVTGVELESPPTAQVAAVDWQNGSEPTEIFLTFDTTQFNSDSKVISQEQNGFGAGSLTGVTVDDEGNVVAAYSNGVKSKVAALSLAKFTNAEGLKMAGSNTFEQTAASGAPRVGLSDPELGTIYSYSLEQSNVDMAAEMVDMITIQRGYQANSKIITTVDDMLGELINLKR